MQWKPTIDDTKAHAPVLLSILSAVASRRLGGTTKASSSWQHEDGSHRSIKSRSNNIYKVQAMLTGALLYAGHAPKRVCIIRTLVTTG